MASDETPAPLRERIARRVQYFPDGADLVVVAANSGMPSPPAWYLNLRAHPRARVEIPGRERALKPTTELRRVVQPRERVRREPLARRGERRVEP